MVTTSYIAGAVIILIAWAVIIFTCVIVIHRRRARRSNTVGAGRSGQDIEAARARTTTRQQQPKPANREFSPVPAYHRRESYGGPAVPPAVYAGGAGVNVADMPPAYSAPAAATPTPDNTCGTGAASGSSGGNTSSSTTC